MFWARRWLILIILTDKHRLSELCLFQTPLSTEHCCAFVHFGVHAIVTSLSKQLVSGVQISKLSSVYSLLIYEVASMVKISAISNPIKEFGVIIRYTHVNGTERRSLIQIIRQFYKLSPHFASVSPKHFNHIKYSQMLHFIDAQRAWTCDIVYHGAILSCDNNNRSVTVKKASHKVLL